MAISFEKHRQQIIAAWKDVLDDRSTTNWSLFSYEGQTNELKVDSSGEGGLEELCEDLNSAKIMYAFVRIEDCKTNLTKFLLINWQGEGAPILRKGTCANHITDVQKILTGAHLTINARTEDDIDYDRILKQLNNIGGGSSSFKFKESSTKSTSINNENNNDVNEQKNKIGTNYNRVIPAKELNSKEMQNFWQKQKEEEQNRIELEKERKRLELLKHEEELRAREEKEYLEREKKTENIQNKLQPAHVPIKTSPQPLSPEKTIGSPTRVMTEAERMRQQRSQEARELIGSRVGTAKAMFTQNTTDSQAQTKSAPAKPARNSITQRINALNNPQQQNDANLSQTINSIVDATSNKEIPVPPEVRIEANNDDQQQQQQINDDNAEPEEQYSTIKRSPHSKTNSLASPDESNKTIENQVSNGSSNIERTIVNNGQNDVVSTEDIIYQDILSDGGLKARALYDYQAADESEITFDPGDIITHIDQIDEGWWQGLGPDGTYGLFPANYVELIN